MPPTRTKPLPRASAALLPPYVVPEGPGGRLDADSLRDMIYENSEGRRIRLNAELCKARAATAAAPNDKRAAIEYKHARDDYEDEFGKFVVDEEIPEYLAKMTRREEYIHKLRDATGESLPCAGPPHVSDVKAADFTVFSDRAPFQAYFDATDKYLADFGVDFKTNDFWDDLLDKRRKQLAVLKMLDRVCGDNNEQREKIVGRQACHITVQNPFTGRDLLRRAEFDAFLREHFASFLDEKNLNIGPTLDKPKFKFSLPNKWYNNPLDERCLEVFCQHEIWRAEIKAAVSEARIRSMTHASAATVPAASFYA
ncbi:hypothetical protein B0H13DRAFT_1891535 [Mycena leptocephala]|nr:hypothetical protein B0H13DRAFT_1891535 [Mycena leptocephala]